MKTFAELGLTFEFDENCATCTDGSCHNISTYKNDGEEYSVHISTDKEFQNFTVYAYPISDIDESAIDESFDNEEKAVNFICTNFAGFKCF